jgi:hypothetical protein
MKADRKIEEAERLRHLLRESHALSKSHVLTKLMVTEAKGCSEPLTIVHKSILSYKLLDSLPEPIHSPDKLEQQASCIHHNAQVPVLLQGRSTHF